MLSWGLTWICLGIIQLFGRGNNSQQIMGR